MNHSYSVAVRTEDERHSLHNERNKINGFDLLAGHTKHTRGSGARGMLSLNQTIDGVYEMTDHIRANEYICIYTFGLVNLLTYHSCTSDVDAIPAGHLETHCD